VQSNFLEIVDIEKIKQIAVESGKVVMKIYNRDFSVEYKDDKSPLTEADIEANRIICNSLEQLYPNIPILSEENIEVDFDVRKNWQYYWCIDPIDGTKEFIKKNGEFTINISLIFQNRPVLGVVFAPALNDIYWSKKGFGAFKNGEKLPLKIKKTDNNLTVVISHSKSSSQLYKYIESLEKESNINLVSKGSSLKFCLVAEGKADIYPRFSPIREWDTSASHSILLESGKDIYQYESGKQISYNKPDLHHPWFIVK